jgi:hypothetical protein
MVRRIVVIFPGLRGGGGVPVPLGRFVHGVVADPYVAQAVPVQADLLRRAGAELEAVAEQVPIHEEGPEAAGVLGVGHEEHLLAAEAVEQGLDELGGDRALLLEVGVPGARALSRLFVLGRLCFFLARDVGVPRQCPGPSR